MQWQADNGLLMDNKTGCIRKLPDHAIVPQPKNIAVVHKSGSPLMSQWISWKILWKQDGKSTFEEPKKLLEIWIFGR